MLGSTAEDLAQFLHQEERLCSVRLHSTMNTPAPVPSALSWYLCAPALQLTPWRNGRAGLLLGTPSAKAMLFTCCPRLLSAVLEGSLSVGCAFCLSLGWRETQQCHCWHGSPVPAKQDYLLQWPSLLWAQCSFPWPCSNADLALGREESRKMQTEGEYVVALSLSTPLCSVLSGVSALRAELCQSWPGNPLGLHSNNCLLCFVDSGRGIPRGKQQV